MAINIFGTKGRIQYADPTEPIDAKRLIQHYRSNGRIIYLHSNNTGPAIDGFSFPVDELQQLIDQEGTDRIYFAVGYHNPDDDTSNDFPDNICGDTDIQLHEGYTLVAFSMDQECNVLNGANDLIFDYCDPCPPRCPKNI